jgi:hypothetical protein
VDERFDDFTRALGSTLPRRRMVVLLAGALAGSVLGLRPAHAANSCGETCRMRGGQCIRCGQTCRTDADCADDTSGCRYCRCDNNFSGMQCRRSKGRRADCVGCL